MKQDIKSCCEFFAESFMEIFYSVKCYDKSNMKVFTLSLFTVGLNLF